MSCRAGCAQALIARGSVSSSTLRATSPGYNLKQSLQVEKVEEIIA
jgi:hypothetical protein